ncbi:MAG: class I SAM-dependent methyltransferase [Pseudomonadota bacterium]
MSFSVDWLTLREHYDAQSRNRDLIERLDLATTFRPYLSVLDLGAGTGSMMRHLAPHLRPPQHWLLADHDEGLLSRAEPPGLAVTAETKVTDLVLDLDELPWDDVDLVTASALLDLVSEHWLTQLYERCLAANAALYACLSYSGRMIWTPADEDDAWIADQFNLHQRTDKGFGAALGPTSADRAADLFRHANWLVETGPSDWHFKPADGEIQQVLATDIAAAVQQIQPSDAVRIADWRQRRLEVIEGARSSLLVGHTDVLAMPSGPR